MNQEKSSIEQSEIAADNMRLNEMAGTLLGGRSVNF